MAIDWLNSTNQQRIYLFEAVTRLFKMRELTLEILFRDALGKNPATITPSFIDNFRKGKISTANAALIYRYLASHHKDSLPALNAATSTASAFWEFLKDYRRIGALDILPDMIEIPFRINRLGPEWREFPFDVTAPIEFRLRLPQIYEGALAIQHGFPRWYPIALEEPFGYEFADVAPPKPRAPHAFIKPVTQGAQVIPTTPPSQGERKRRRLGPNFFVFFAGPYWLLEEVSAGWEMDKPITNAQLDFLADRFITERLEGWSVAQINADGMGPMD